MNSTRRYYLLLKELGLSQLVPYALYKAQLKSGKFEKITLDAVPNLEDPIAALKKAFIFVPSLPEGSRKSEILKHAEEIISGQFHPFSGSSLAPIELSPRKPLQHWTKYSDTLDDKDIKTIWEPARFSWVFPLCQAFLITADDRFAAYFWKAFEQFTQDNPVDFGPAWISGQEAALRLIPWMLAAQTFTESPESTPERVNELLNAVWQSTCRVSLTLNYSRSQNNNHFLSEALGLMIGGAVFSSTSAGQRWLKKGSASFQAGILQQVEKNGTYSQHSANYHRLMLHLALIYVKLAEQLELSIPEKVSERLAMATRWAAAQMDEKTGHLPNLGHNDGSNLLPLGSHDYLDYRPTIQAACSVWVGSPCLPAGQWDELSHWLGIQPKDPTIHPLKEISCPAIHSITRASTRAFLRTARFRGRPAHADLLTVDLWHEGINVLQDAGTYAYNLPDPWQNCLARTDVHNTISVADQDQMIWTGKFLWLERAQAMSMPAEPGTIAGILYCNLPTAYTQIRTVGFVSDSEFQVLDRIELARLEKEPQKVTIQYLLPDGAWQLDENKLSLTLNNKNVSMIIQGQDPHDQSSVPAVISLIRAGKTLYGEDKSRTRGWFSPTYLEKEPALSISASFSTTKSLEILTRIIL